MVWYRSSSPLFLPRSIKLPSLSTVSRPVSERRCTLYQLQSAARQEGEAHSYSNSAWGNQSTGERNMFHPNFVKDRYDSMLNNYLT